MYETFPRKPMTELTDALKREHRAAEKCHICLKEFNDPRNRKVRDTATTSTYIEEQPTIIAT